VPARDAAKLLEGSPELLIYTPVVGYLFMIQESVSPSILQSYIGGRYIWLLSISIFLSSFIFNYSLGNPEKTGRKMTLAVVLSFIIHTVLLLHVNIEMANYLQNGSNIYAVGIVALSILYISLLSTNRLIRYYTKENSS
jgi:tetrahydromethanopterin S-methyltransferase subunit C